MLSSNAPSAVSTHHGRVERGHRQHSRLHVSVSISLPCIFHACSTWLLHVAGHYMSPPGIKIYDGPYVRTTTMLFDHHCCASTENCWLLALVGLGVNRSHEKISLLCFNQEMKLFIKSKNVFFAKTRNLKK